MTMTYFLHGAVDLPDGVSTALVDLAARGVGVRAFEPMYLVQSGVGHVLEAELADPQQSFLGTSETAG
jgi:hypothetical protein